MINVEIKNYYDSENKKEIKALFVDGQLFDWNISILEIEKAAQACKDKSSHRAIHANIQDHFLKCFSIFLKKEITLKEVNEAIEKGSLC